MSFRYRDPANAKFRRKGYDDDTIALARAQKEASARAGSQRSLLEILEQRPLSPPKNPAAVEPTRRKLRRRGRRGRLALGVRLEAESETNPEIREKLKLAETLLTDMPEGQRQSEFEFFVGGNWSTSRQYFRDIKARLDAAPLTGLERRTAIAVLTVIWFYLPWEDYTCQRHAAELAPELSLTPAVMSRTLGVLEQVRAIVRVKRGRTKVITVTPEGAYRGNLDRHDETVDRWSAEVRAFSKASQSNGASAARA